MRVRFLLMTREMDLPDNRLPSLADMEAGMTVAPMVDVTPQMAQDAALSLLVAARRDEAA